MRNHILISVILSLFITTTFAKPYQQPKELEENRMLYSLEDTKNKETYYYYTSLILLLVTGTGLIYFLVRTRELQGKNKDLSNKLKKVKEQKEQVESEVTALQNSKETMLAANMELQQKIANQSQKIVLSTQELNSFLYRASHDLKGPAATLAGLCKVAKISTEDPMLLEIFSKIDVIAIDMKNMLTKLRMIHDIQYSELEYEVLELDDILGDVKMEFLDNITDNNITFDIEFITEVDGFYSNALMVEYIIHNLIENSIMFRKPGNQSIVSVKLMQENDDLIIFVEDNGIGIAKEYKDRVFDMYFRSGEANEGHGLGLFVVSKAVNKLEGSISFDSQVWEGTCFEIKLPNLKVIEAKKIEEETEIPENNG